MGAGAQSLRREENDEREESRGCEGANRGPASGERSSAAEVPILWRPVGLSAPPGPAAPFFILPSGSLTTELLAPARRPAPFCTSRTLRATNSNSSSRALRARTSPRAKAGWTNRSPAAPDVQAGGRGKGMRVGRYSVAMTTASGWAGRGDIRPEGETPREKTPW
ncbi:hypothetical protein HPG69_000138 [Diceros bicornis minor]|uniref:Uncharacterized protein n=1 Tax=Diceros bicornis minor TaxID=77932 RepID=A0A7J7EUT4_DICBM|nr:hypothetical protein HPG69_000138 [Diceros bicornis minor]